MYRDLAHFGEHGRTLTEHILSTEQDINKRQKALTPHGAALSYEPNMQKTLRTPPTALKEYKALAR